MTSRLETGLGVLLLTTLLSAPTSSQPILEEFPPISDVCSNDAGCFSTDHSTVENISKDLGASFDSVVTLLDETIDLEEIEAKLRSDLGDQMRSVRLGLLPDFKKRLAIPSSARRLARANENQEPERPQSRRRVATAAPDARYYVPEPGVLTTPAAAEYLALSPTTLDTMRSRGGGPVFVKLGRRVVYRREDLDGWVREGRRRSTSDEPGVST